MEKSKMSKINKKITGFNQLMIRKLLREEIT